MKRSLARRAVTGAAVLLPALMLVALIWFATLGWLRDQRRDVEARAAAQAGNQAASWAQQVHRQLGAIDQTLRMLTRSWEADPAGFKLESFKDIALAISDITQDIMLVDNHGRVVQSTIPEAVGLYVADKDYFRYALAHGASQDGDYVGPAAVDRFMRQWHMPVARWMRNPDRSFAGLIVTDYRAQALQDLFHSGDLGSHGLVELVGLPDGRLRTVTGALTGAADESIADTPMFEALLNHPDGSWAGPSAPDGIERLHAFRIIADQGLALVVGLSTQDALGPFSAWDARARQYATWLSALILILAGLLLYWLELSHRRETALAHERGLLAAANAQLEVARARADAKASQLEATLSGMSDGIAMVDAHLCLMEWNRHFPEIAGVPEHILRVGLPMEEILRAQAESGQFGSVDVEAEVARRMGLLRAGVAAAAAERQRPDGRTIELRRDPLPDGGFVTLYRDITARQQAERAAREARAAAESATAAKSRFVAIVSHEIRSPLNALLNTIRLLGDGAMSASQQALVRMARQSGDALLGLINDILDLSSIEAGQLALRPSAFVLAPLLRGTVEMFQAQAAERGITLRLAVEDGVPSAIYTDPGRLRQVLINLLSNAVKFGLPGEVVLLARHEPDQVGRAMLRLSVRDRGPVIEPEGRARLFRPFSRLDAAPGVDEPLGSGLGLSICRYLVGLMGGEIDCDIWLAEDGRPGNDFWLRVPLLPIPAGARPGAPVPDGPPRLPLPRTRILLVEDVLANQLITATLLRREGHLVDVAASGAAALQAVRSQPYDLVFTDIYMPGQSGLDLAQAIRRLPGASGTVPIVALTANVGADDRLACQRAGINDLLPKPVTLPDLLSAITRYAWRGRGDRPAVLRPPARAQAQPVLSANRIGELREALPADTLSSMVEECLVDLQARLPSLRDSLRDGSNEELASQAHAMTGMAAGYGMAALETRLRALMKAARSGNRAAAAELADQLETELAQTAEALREALQIEVV